MKDEEVLELSKQLISLQTVPENTEALEKSLDLALAQLGDFQIERFVKNGSKSALVFNTVKRPRKFKVILNGHLDVIPGKLHQYSPKIVKDRLYGVGAMDMKSNVACLISVYKEVATKVNYPLGLQLVTDEELGGFDGTKYQIEKGVRADFVIAGETTQFNIAHKAKGILWVKIVSKGKTGHGAYPWKGTNAIMLMHAFLTLLETKYPTPRKAEWVTTVNVARIETSNQTFNKIPDDCVAHLDIRYIAEDEASITKSLKQLMPRGFKLEVVAKEPALYVDQGNHYVQQLRKICRQVIRKNPVLYGAQGSSDARHYMGVGGHGVEFGPIGGGIGSDIEWTDINGLKKYCQILREFLLSLES